MSGTASLTLDVRGLCAGYGRFDVVHDLSLKVEAGEFVSLLGANGAGKSTTLRAISGFIRPTAGTVAVVGTAVGGWAPHRLGRGYVTMVPEGRRLFADQTVEANLILGAYHLRRDRKRVAELLQGAYELFPRLYEYRKRLASHLSGGEQQMVAIGRALMADPAVLLLDEPSLGLAPQIIAALFSTLAELRDRGRSVLLVEQRVEEALALSTRAYVMQQGRIAMEGPASELVSHPDLVNAYLGEESLAQRNDHEEEGEGTP